jgi:hypothetical protein
MTDFDHRCIDVISAELDHMDLDLISTWLVIYQVPSWHLDPAGRQRRLSKTIEPCQPDEEI